MTETPDKLPEPDKIVELYRERAAFNKDMSAVIGGDKDNSMGFSNIMLDYLERTSLFKYLKPGKNDVILDYGCGLGRLTFPVAEHAKEAYGVDLSPELIAIAEKAKKEGNYTNVHFGVIKPATFRLPDAKFNKIFALGVMIHIGNNLLKEMMPVMLEHMTDDGQLILLEYTRAKTELSENVIIRSADDFKRDFEACGLECTLIKPVIRMPSYAISLWKKFNVNWKFLLPILYQVERSTIHRKPEFINYHWYIMVFRKKKQ